MGEKKIMKRNKLLAVSVAAILSLTLAGCSSTSTSTTSSDSNGNAVVKAMSGEDLNKIEKDDKEKEKYLVIDVRDEKEYKEAFEKAFFEEKLVGKLLKYSKDSNDYPFSVMWYEDENNYRLYGKVIGQNYSQYGVQYNVDKDDEYYIDFTYSKDQDWFDFGHFNEEETIYFIPSEILLNKVEASKKVLSLTTMDNGTTGKNLVNNTELHLIKSFTLDHSSSKKMQVGQGQTTVIPLLKTQITMTKTM